MSLHFVAALVGTLVAAAGTGVLAARYRRARAGPLLAWTIALFGLTVALAAQALGYSGGFGPASFRAMELGAQVVAPLALALGLAELAGRGISARFAAWLAVSAVAVVSLVVLGTDPLSGRAFSKVWPSPSVYYQLIPVKLLEYLLLPVTVVMVLIAFLATVIRRSQQAPGWPEALPSAAAASVAALALEVPSFSLVAQGHLGMALPAATLFAPICVLAAALTWLAGARAASLRMGVLRDPYSGADDDWGGQAAWADEADRAVQFDPTAAGGSIGQHGRTGFYRDDFGDDADYRGPAGYDEPEPDGGYGQYGDDDGYGEDDGYDDGFGETAVRDPRYPGAVGDPRYPDAAGGHPYGAMPSAGGGRNGLWQAGEAGAAALGARQDPLGARRDPGGGDPEAGRDLIGQIAIYTLLEDRVPDFDRLTKGVVRQVRAEEPGTLVYIVHAVPAAPMQRILYEVYRDRAAYEEHRRRPYIVRFEAERRHFVLATNVIELGLQQAKVSPLPSITELLSDTGYDLLKDTGFGQPGYGPRPGGGAGGAPRPGSGAAGAAPGGTGRAGGAGSPVGKPPPRRSP